MLFLVVLGVVGQATTLYTDWLWFGEVGYREVFLTILLSHGSVVGLAASAVFTVVYTNARIAASRASPGVLWQLDNQLRLPAQGVLNVVLGRALPLFLAVVSFLVGLASGGQWQTVLTWWYQVPFDVRDPLFVRDVGFFVFTVPAWRLLLAWATGLVIASFVLAALVHLLRGASC